MAELISIIAATLASVGHDWLDTICKKRYLYITFSIVFSGYIYEFVNVLENAIRGLGKVCGVLDFGENSGSLLSWQTLLMSDPDNLHNCVI